MKKTRLPLLLCFILLSTSSTSGCARYHWVNPNKTTTEFNQDRYKCNIESSKVYPPIFKTITKPQTYQSTSQIDCTKAHNKSTCTTVNTGYVMPATEVIDANLSNREDLFHQCMQLQGWRWEKVEEN